MNFKFPIFLLTGFIACTQQNEPSPELPQLSGNKSYAILSCEGIFPRGNAGISIINTKSGQVWEDVYFQSNHRKIGDVLQSISFKNGKAYCVINNSSEIEVLDINTWKTVQTIQNIGKPRYLHFTGHGQIWVTTIFSRQIYILDENTLETIKIIPFPHWSEQMVQIGDSLYFNSPEASYLYRASISRQKIEDSIELPGPSSALLQSGNTIWVAFKDKSTEKTGVIGLINQEPFVSHLTNEKAGLSTRLAFNSTSDTLFLLSHHLFRFPTTKVSSTLEIFHSGKGKSYYALGVHPSTNQVWLADAIDFQQKASVEVYSGGHFQWINSFKVGLIPGHIYFY